MWAHNYKVVHSLARIISQTDANARGKGDVLGDDADMRQRERLNGWGARDRTWE